MHVAWGHVGAGVHHYMYMYMSACSWQSVCTTNGGPITAHCMYRGLHSAIIPAAQCLCCGQGLTFQLVYLVDSGCPWASGKLGVLG